MGMKKTAAPKKSKSAVKAKKASKAKPTSPPKKPSRAKSPSELIDQRIEALGDWRGELLSRLRNLIKSVVPSVVEEWKWRGVPVWYQDGMICTGETYKDVVKLTFAQGAQLADPARLFNSSLAGNTRRAIDFRQGEKVNEKALKTLVRDAVKLNQSKS